MQTIRTGSVKPGGCRARATPLALLKPELFRQAANRCSQRRAISSEMKITSDVLVYIFPLSDFSLPVVTIPQEMRQLSTSARENTDVTFTPTKRTRAFNTA
jgi:hypothetical protein